MGELGAERFSIEVKLLIIDGALPADVFILILGDTQVLLPLSKEAVRIHIRSRFLRVVHSVAGHSVETRLIVHS